MKVNNEFYETLGKRWYEAEDDPVALLRAEAKCKNQWVKTQIEKFYGDQKLKILDIGCGAGFLTNFLSELGHKVTGVDLSMGSLKEAQAHDTTKSVVYLQENAYHLSFTQEHFDVVLQMDFLEHVENPQDAIKEAARVLKKGGHYFFHTFNRNWLSHLIIIKGVEWMVKNTPKNMHVIDLFITPQEIDGYCRAAGLASPELVGIRPRLNKAFLKMLLTGNIPQDFEFTLTESHLLGYLGTTCQE